MLRPGFPSDMLLLAVAILFAVLSNLPGQDWLIAGTWLACMIFAIKSLFEVREMNRERRRRALIAEMIREVGAGDEIALDVSYLIGTFEPDATPAPTNSDFLELMAEAEELATYNPSRTNEHADKLKRLEKIGTRFILCAQELSMVGFGCLLLGSVCRNGVMTPSELNRLKALAEEKASGYRAKFR